MRRRQERFARDAEREAKPGSGRGDSYGLISRGEDTRLKDDETARQGLLNDTQRRAHEYEQKNAGGWAAGNDSERDSILLAFRKLRESVIAVDGSRRHTGEALSEPEKRFFREVYLSSIQFGVHCGSPESYVPALQWVLPVAAAGRWAFTPTEHEWLVLRLAEQLAVVEQRYEESLLLLNTLLRFTPVDLDAIHPNNPVEQLYLTVVKIINNNYHVTGLSSRGAARVAQLLAQQRIVSYRGSERYEEGEVLKKETEAETGSEKEKEGGEGTKAGRE